MTVRPLGWALLLFLAIAAGTFLLPSHRWDVAVTVWLQHAPQVLDLPAAALVFLADAEISIPLIVLVGLLLARRDRRRVEGVAWLAAGMLAASAVAFFLKWVLPHPGPPLEFQRMPHRVGLYVPQPFSFPSGHTMRTTFFAVMVLRRTPPAAGALVITVMAALVYLGDHWTSDVLGGLCLGWACAEIARGLRPPA